MIKNITLRSLSTTPDDYTCPDGELALSLGLVPDDGTLRPLAQPDPFLRVSGGRLLLVHTDPAPANTRYIFLSDPDPADSAAYLYAVDPAAISDAQIALNPSGAHGLCQTIAKISGFRSVTPVGNILVLSTDSSILYYIRRAGAYTCLGDRVPDCHIQFAKDISLPAFKASSFIPALDDWENRNRFSTVPAYKDFVHLHQDDATVIKDALWGFVNKIYANDIAGNALFSMPMLLRYAIKLYDGSYVVHSAPILVSLDGHNPLVSVIKYINNSWQLNISLSAFKLKFRILQDFATEFSQWSDIISSVDIFASLPLYTYNQAGPDKDYAISRPTVDDDYSVIVPLNSLPQQLADTANFHLIASIPFADLTASESFRDLPIKSVDYLQSLASHPSLPDDFHSHDSFSARSVTAYNDRLHLADISISPFPGFNPESYTPMLSGTGPLVDSQCRWAVRIDSLGDSHTIVSDTVSASIPCPFSRHAYGDPLTADRDLFVFYPDPAAKQLIISFPSHFTVSIPLAPHDFLNGAYAYVPAGSPLTEASFPSASDTRPISLHNKVYVSDPANPFVFPAQSVVSVGSTSVLALAAAARPLSEGQFGQFPLYAFTDQGVWALETTATGTYSARQPITRDVCIDPDAITPTDSAVVFPSARGLMLLSGRQSLCLTDSIDARLSYHVSDSLPLVTDPCPLSAFLAGCGILYDYSHQRLILFNRDPNIRYAYIYSITDKAWTMLSPADIAASVPSYPQCWALTHSGGIIDFSSDPDDISDSGPLTPVTLITRPLKLDAPDILKTVDTVILRGRFPKDAVTLILHGSRDLIHWHTVAAASPNIRGIHGTPYKYFRVAIRASLAPSHFLSAISISYTPRFTARLR